MATGFHIGTYRRKDLTTANERELTEYRRYHVGFIFQFYNLIPSLTARFVIWEGKDVLQVPASSLFRKGDEWEVFAVRNGKARLRRVQVGHRTGLAAEIVSGLSEGDKMIAHPDDSINDGTRVKPRK